MDEIGDGQNARGVFSNSAPRYGGRRFNWARRQMGALDRFAEELSKHDLETGDLGGSVPEVSRRLGIKPQQGNAMLQRIRTRLGRQAR